METLSQTLAERKPPLYKRIIKSLGFWVIIGIITGIVLGYTDKELAIASKPGVDYFIGALKVLIGPIIFVTLVLGIISLESLKKVGSIGAKAVIYFEVVSTLALAIGIFMANVMQPGHGMNLDPSQLDTKSVQKYISQTTEVSASSEIMHILKDAMPTDIITPFTEGKTIQVLVIAIITALIISLMRIEDKQAIQRVFEVVQNFVFKILQIIMYFSPNCRLFSNGCTHSSIRNWLFDQLSIFTFSNADFMSCFYIWNLRSDLLFCKSKYLQIYEIYLKRSIDRFCNQFKRVCTCSFNEKTRKSRTF